MPRAHDKSVPSTSNITGPMTRSRLKIKREREEEAEFAEENPWDRGDECDNTQKRIDLTPLDAFTIASSMLNCSFGRAESGSRAQSPESEEDHHSLQQNSEQEADADDQSEQKASPTTEEAAWCRSDGSGYACKINAFLAASEMLQHPLADLSEMETEVAIMDPNYLIPPTPPPPPPTPVIKKKKKLSISSYRERAKCAREEPVAEASSNEGASPTAATELNEAGGAFKYLHVDLGRLSRLI